MSKNNVVRQNFTEIAFSLEYHHINTLIAQEKHSSEPTRTLVQSIATLS